MPSTVRPPSRPWEVLAVPDRLSPTRAGALVAEAVSPTAAAAHACWPAPASGLAADSRPARRLPLSSDARTAGSRRAAAVVPPRTAGAENGRLRLRPAPRPVVAAPRLDDSASWEPGPCCSRSPHGPTPGRLSAAPVEVEALRTIRATTISARAGSRGRPGAWMLRDRHRQPRRTLRSCATSRAVTPPAYAVERRPRGVLVSPSQSTRSVFPRADQRRRNRTAVALARPIGGSTRRLAHMLSRRSHARRGRGTPSHATVVRSWSRDPRDVLTRSLRLAPGRGYSAEGRTDLPAAVKAATAPAVVNQMPDGASTARRVAVGRRGCSDVPQPAATGRWCRASRWPGRSRPLAWPSGDCATLGGQLAAVMAVRYPAALGGARHAASDAEPSGVPAGPPPAGRALLPSWT